MGAPANVIQGLDHAVGRAALVANLSLGWSEVFHGWACNNADCILCQAVDNAVRLGMTVVVAAGNEGNAGAKPPFAIRHAGAARLAITVGAIDKQKQLAAFSSLGLSSGRLSPASPLRLTKPDPSAPGVGIVSQPALCPMMIKKLLLRADRLPPNQAGYGIINGYAAVLRAMSTGLGASLAAGQTT